MSTCNCRNFQVFQLSHFLDAFSLDSFMILSGFYVVVELKIFSLGAGSAACFVVNFENTKMPPTTELFVAPKLNIPPLSSLLIFAQKCSGLGMQPQSIFEPGPGGVVAGERRE